MIMESRRKWWGLMEDRFRPEEEQDLMEDFVDGEEELEAAAEGGQGVEGAERAEGAEGLSGGKVDVTAEGKITEGDPNRPEAR